MSHTKLDMEIRPLPRDDPRWGKIQKYFDNGKDWLQVEISEIFELDRHQDRERFRQFSGEDRIYLWHGPRGKISSILSQGLLPINSPRIWLSVSTWIAVRFHQNEKLYPNSLLKRGFLLLCEVAPGKTTDVNTYLIDKMANLNEYDTVRCYGEKTPDPDENAALDGAVLPLGKHIESKKWPISDHRVDYYAVDNPARIGIPYIVAYRPTNQREE